MFQSKAAKPLIARRAAAPTSPLPGPTALASSKEAKVSPLGPFRVEEPA
jgi:hypothetical protein